MQQIYRQSDQHFEVYTTVFSPPVCRSRIRSGTGTRHVEAEKVVVVVQHRSSWQKELDLNQGDLIHVLFKEDEAWWFGRLSDGMEGFFPAACVEPLQGGDSSGAPPMLVRRGSVPVAMTTEGASCGCTSGLSTPRLLRKSSVRRPLGLDWSSVAPPPHGSSVAPPHGSSVAPPPHGSSVAPPPRRSSVAPPPHGSSVAPPPRRSSVAPPSHGSLVAPPPRRSSVAPPPHGSSVAPPPHGSPVAPPPHGSPSLLHRVLSKSRRKSCPHLPPPLETGSINTAFQPD